jgi:hypothetical protein
LRDPGKGIADVLDRGGGQPLGQLCKEGADGDLVCCEALQVHEPGHEHLLVVLFSVVAFPTVAIWIDGGFGSSRIPAVFAPLRR